MVDETKTDNEEKFKKEFEIARQMFEDNPDDYEQIAKQLKKALRFKPNDKEAGLLLSFMKHYIGELSFKSLIEACKRAYKNHTDLDDDQFDEYLTYLTEACFGENEYYWSSIERQRRKVDHNELMEAVGTISLSCEALERCASLYEERFSTDVLKKNKQYIDVLKNLSLCYSKMFKKCKCTSCGDCEASRWKISGDLLELFEKVNEKIRDYDAEYIPPSVSDRLEKKYANNNAKKPKTITEKIKKAKLGLIYAPVCIAVGIICAVLSSFASALVPIGTVLIIGGIGYLLATLAITDSLKQRKDAYCPKCNRKYSVKEINGIKEISKRTTERAVISTLTVLMRCKECGRENLIVKEVTLTNIDENGWVRSHSIEECMKEYFNKS
jgi:hypothetical protein